MATIFTFPYALDNPFEFYISPRVLQEIMEYINKKFCVAKKCQMPVKYHGNFLSGSWQYWSNLHVLPNASLFCFHFRQ